MTNLILILSFILSFPAQGDQLARADKLFRERDNLESLKQAVSLVEEIRSRDQSSYEASWRLSKYRFYLSDREKDEAKKTRLLEAGIEAGKKAVAANDKGVEGHFWLAANFGEYADIKGALQSLGLVKTIRKEFEAALAIDPAYENGAIFLALGQIDLHLPRLFGGNDRRGLERLEAGLKVGATNAELKLALAEIYEKKSRRDESRKLLESVLSVTDSARTPREQEELRTKARVMLDKMR